jgi:hypothetical protein
MQLSDRVAKLEKLKAQTGYDAERDGPMTIILTGNDPDPVLPPGHLPRIVLDFRGVPSEDIQNATHLRFRPEDANA